MYRFFEKFRWPLFSLHLLMMAVIPVTAIAARLSDYSVRLYHPTAALILITALSCLLAVGIFFGMLSDKHAFPVRVLGHLDLALALASNALLLHAAPSRLNAGLAALFLISALMITISMEGGDFTKWLFFLLGGVPFACFILTMVIAVLTPNTNLPSTVYHDLVSPDGVYTAEAKTFLGKDDVYYLESIRVTETEKITENPIFRLYPNVRVIAENTWKSDSVPKVDWLNTRALLVGDLEYPIHGARTLPVNTGGL